MRALWKKENLTKTSWQNWEMEPNIRSTGHGVISRISKETKAEKDTLLLCLNKPGN